MVRWLVVGKSEAGVGVVGETVEGCNWDIVFLFCFCRPVSLPSI